MVISLIAGLFLGFLLAGTVRFATQEPVVPAHYHANWAVFVNGQRLDLTDTRYMEDVLRCVADPTQQEPEDRVHMHENNHDIVHVHATGVTWGQLFSNLGFHLGSDFFYTDRDRFVSTPEKSLKLVLNGIADESVSNRLIGDRDRLLISYGPETLDQVIATQAPLVGSDADHYNLMPDPASCSGAVEETTGARIRRAFWF